MAKSVHSHSTSWLLSRELCNAVQIKVECGVELQAAMPAKVGRADLGLTHVVQDLQCMLPVAQLCI